MCVVNCCKSLFFHTAKIISAAYHYIVMAVAIIAGITVPGITSADNQVSHIEPILPIPQQLILDPDRVKLGERLFNDERLSVNGKYACVNCHYLDKGGTDQEPLSPVISGGYRERNTPTIFNVGLLPIYNWYGKAVALPDLAEDIIKSKKGLAEQWPAIISKLTADADYKKDFRKLYGSDIQPEHVKDALAEYLRSLITPNSRFDRYLRGESDAINERELHGYELFKAYGCASCHQGVNLGGNMVSPFGIFADYKSGLNNSSGVDLGRFNLTGLEEDKYVFRVPSLRNVMLTPPYLHDGSIDDIEEAISIMGDYMLGRSIPAEDVKLIADFLHTLTGEYKGEPL